MKTSLIRCFSALLIVFVAGCAGTHRARTYVTEPPFRLPAGAKIALVEGSFDKALFDQELSNSQNLVRREGGPPIQNPVGGAAVGAVGGTAMGALAGFGCGPLFVICVPLGAAVGLVGGAVGGAVMGAQNAKRYGGHDTAHKPIDRETSETKATTELLEKLVPSMESIPARIQRLIEPLNDRPEYLFEIAPPDTAFYLKYNYFYNYAVGTRGRILRVSDRAVVHRFIATESIYLSSDMLATSSTTEVARTLNSKLEPALNELAKKFTDRWIVPVGGGIRKPDSPVTTSLSSSISNDDYLNCVQLGLEKKCDEYVSCFSGGKRQWTHQSKCDAPGTSEKPLRKDCVDWECLGSAYQNEPSTSKEQIDNKEKEPIKDVIPPAGKPVDPLPSDTGPAITQTPNAPPTESAFPRCDTWGCRSGPQ